MAVRGLLLATALAPPYILALSGEGRSGGLGALGPFVVASSAAAVSSAYVWGRLADRSSRLVLGGVFGFLAEVTGQAAVLGIFAVHCIAAALGARSLGEVQTVRE